MDVTSMGDGYSLVHEERCFANNVNSAAPDSIQRHRMSMNCIARTAATQSVMSISGASTSHSCRQHGETHLISVVIASDLKAACMRKTHSFVNLERAPFSGVFRPCSVRKQPVFT